MSTMHTIMEIETIILEGDLVLKNTERFRNQLISYSDPNNDVKIEFREVQKWDVAGIQLLYSCKRHFALHDKNISFVFANPEEVEIGKEWIELINNNL